MRRDVQSLLRESLVLPENHRKKHPLFLWTLRKADVKAAFAMGKVCKDESNKQRSNSLGRQDEAEPEALPPLEFRYADP